MSHIVAGRFEQVLDANAALDELKRGGFADAEVELFYVAPPGQHGTYPIGGDAHSDAGARFGGWGAALGALIGGGVGLALGTMLSLQRGFIAVFLLVGIGAWVGSLIGALLRMHAARPGEADREHPAETPAGTMVAVNVDRPQTLDRAVEALRRHGARDIGAARGEWSNGSWKDFDPRTPLGAI
jgi:predicted lipid-binding transport protein (Tim44 family)